MFYLFFIIVLILFIQSIFRLALDTNNKTGDVICWYNWFGERKFFVLIRKFL